MTQALRRLSALDQMRGLVMVLMTIDHASEWLNAGRFVTDASWFWKPGSPIPGDQFVLRWVTHLCAPTFVFLAGVGIALSTAKRRAQGDSEAAIDRTLIARGLFIVALELFWMTPVMMEGKGILLFTAYRPLGSYILCCFAHAVWVIHGGQFFIDKTPA